MKVISHQDGIVMYESPSGLILRDRTEYSRKERWPSSRPVDVLCPHCHKCLASFRTIEDAINAKIDGIFQCQVGHIFCVSCVPDWHESGPYCAVCQDIAQERFFATLGERGIGAALAEFDPAASRVALYKACREKGLNMLNILEHEMSNDNPDVRAQAVREAGQIGVPALYILERAMGDGDPIVRQEAVIWAGQIGGPALYIVERAMKDEDSEIRWQAVQEAHRFGLSALHILEQALADSDPDVRRWAALEAGKFGLPALHVVEQASADSDPWVRQWAVIGAGKIGLPARHIVEQAMEDEDPFVRSYAVSEANKLGLSAKS